MTKTFASVTKEYFHIFFEESSIHGFPYIVKKSIHVCEKIFWLIVLILSTYAAYYVFNGQYTRYKENPTVLSVELITYRNFPKPGTTICPEFTPEIYEDGKSEYGIDAKDLSEFYFTILNSTILDLSHFRKFSGDKYKYLNDIKLSSILDKFPLLQTNAITDEKIFEKVITEVGVCFTSSRLYFLQVFEDSNSKLNKSTKKPCISNSLCLDIASFKDPRAVAYRVYFHSPDEVVPGDYTRNYNYLEVKKDDKIDLRKSFVRTLRYEEIKSDSDVRKIEIKGRRCLFTDESNGNYYQNYTKNLCKMSCRIQNALNKCGCVPYFYPLIKEKKCNLNGMICLSNTNWTDVSSCKCLEMCDSVIFTSLENKIAKDNFDPKVEFKIILPQTIYKRSVLFDFADLIVGLGGSLALFLGFSFLSAAEIFYFILEYILEIIIEVIIPRLVGIFKRF